MANKILFPHCKKSYNNWDSPESKDKCEKLLKGDIYKSLKADCDEFYGNRWPITKKAMDFYFTQKNYIKLLQMIQAMESNDTFFKLITKGEYAMELLKEIQKDTEMLSTDDSNALVVVCSIGAGYNSLPD